MADEILENGEEFVIEGSAVEVLAANFDRRGLFLQNTGIANVRIGAVGVTATTGIRLAPGSVLNVGNPCPVNAIYAIREGTVSSVVFATEIA